MTVGMDVVPRFFPMLSRVNVIYPLDVEEVPLVVCPCTGFETL